MLGSWTEHSTLKEQIKNIDLGNPQWRDDPVQQKSAGTRLSSM
jgi:hypothetical protein